MVGIQVISDYDGLLRWLGSQPESVPVTIAVRAALRVAPIWFHHCVVDAPASALADPLLAFRVLFITHAQRGHETMIDLNAATADRLFNAHYRKMLSETPFPPVTLDAALSIEHAIGSVTSGLGSRECAREAVKNAVNALGPIAGKRYSLWPEIWADAQLFEWKKKRGPVPLWRGECPISKTWAKVELVLTDTPYDFWRRWYNTLLDPDRHPPMPQDMLYDIALIHPDIWDAGAEAVAEEITKIEARYTKLRESEDPVFDGVSFDSGHVFGGAQEGTGPEGEAVPPAQPTRVHVPAKELAAVKLALTTNRKTLPPTIEALQEFILLEIERWQTSNELNAKVPEECRRQVSNYLSMYEALEGMKAVVTVDRNVTDEEAEEVVGLGRLYLEKFKAIPREKSTHIVEGTLVLGTAAVGTMLGLGSMAAFAVGALTFARPDAKTILSAAKEFQRGDAPVE